MFAISPHKIFPLLICLIAVPVSGSATESLETFIDRVIEVYGGKDALSRAATVRQTGQTVSSNRGGATAILTRVFQRPDKLRVEIAYPGKQIEVRILNGAQGWRRNLEISGPMHSAMQLQAARIALPLLLLEEKANLKDLGIKAGSGGVQFRVLQLPLRPDLILLVAIDVETARIRHSRGAIHAAGSPAMEFATTYDDFRTWNGLLFAGREEQFAMGRYVGHTLIEKVEILADAGPGYFRP